MKHPRWTLLLPVALVATLSLIALPASAQAQRRSLAELRQFAAKDPNSAEFREALVATLGQQRIQAGTAYTSHGEDFLFAVQAPSAPQLFVDDQPFSPVARVEGTDLWWATPKLQPGKNHTFHYLVDGKRMGGSFDVPAYLPESYEQPGVPQGALSPQVTHTSKIYEGMKADYWVYVPAQYDGKTAVPVMVWNDGGGHVQRNGPSRTQNVVDNLIHQKKLPVSLHVFVNPGTVEGPNGRARRLRSIQYDTVDDRYVRYLVEEILAEVGQKYLLRKDGYSRAIVGDSSGAIAAFNAAWQRPDQFSRVLSRIGTYTSIQWKPGMLDGGNIFPFALRKTPRKNIRVWLSDGSEDLENAHGSWPLQNIQMANSLKMAGYDFKFSWSSGSHNGAHGHAEAPLSLAWLWRDYDPARTEQVYEQDPAEKTKPYYRVKIYNRD